jgi:hypothetical protein
MDKIWSIASNYEAAWLSKGYGFYEIYYETIDQKLLAEYEFVSKGFVILQGTSNQTSEEFSRKVHRVFSVI